MLAAMTKDWAEVMSIEWKGRPSLRDARSGFRAQTASALLFLG